MVSSGVGGDFKNYEEQLSRMVVHKDGDSIFSLEFRKKLL